jgi:molecular chaperone HscB
VFAAKNPFEILGLAPSFVLDARELEQRQRDLSKALHPDRHAAGTTAARRAALSEAIYVNEAFRTLRDPVTRAEALLSLLGHAKGAEGETRAQLAPALLMQVMEQREALSTARRSRDRHALAQLLASAHAEQSAVETQLGQCFTLLLAAQNSAIGGAAAPSHEAATPNASVVEASGQALAHLRYIRKLLEEAAAVEDELDAS